MITNKVIYPLAVVGALTVAFIVFVNFAVVVHAAQGRRIVLQQTFTVMPSDAEIEAIEQAKIEQQRKIVEESKNNRRK